MDDKRHSFASNLIDFFYNLFASSLIYQPTLTSNLYIQDTLIIKLIVL